MYEVFKILRDKNVVVLVVCLSMCSLCYELFLCLTHSLQEMYSKGLIPISAVKQVRALGENKFEVVTSVRTFVFRAEKEGEPLCYSRLLSHVSTPLH